MADTPIPDDLLAARRAFDEAHARTVEAARAGDSVVALIAAEAAAAVALHRLREGTEWAGVKQQQAVREAAKG